MNKMKKIKVNAASISRIITTSSEATSGYNIGNIQDTNYQQNKYQEISSSIAIRPVVTENNERVARLNKAIELGYAPPVNETVSAIK